MYVGEFKNGDRHGQGTWTHPDGSRYVGAFKGGLFHGQGTFTFADGRKYVGELKDNKRWNGTQYDKDEFVTATYSEGVRQVVSSTGSSTSTDMVTIDYEEGTYTGELSNGLPNGQGTWTHPDGSRYVGEFKNGDRHGHGTYSFPDGEKYVGEFKDLSLIHI